MKSMHIIITALATACVAKDSIECIFSEATGAQQCSGAVGQLLIFHLPNPANIRLTKDNKLLILSTNGKGKVVRGYADHTKLFENGTLILGNAMKNHSGVYVMEEYESNGRFVRNMTLHLEVQDTIQKPAVSQVCLTPEQMDISCSSRGEDVDFNIRLDDLFLLQTRDQRQFLQATVANIESLTWTENQENQQNVTRVTIRLRGQLKGNLTCCVWNNVSREETVIHLDSCPVKKSEGETSGTVNFDFPGGTFAPFAVVAVAVIASFLALLLVTLACGLTFLKKTPEPLAVDEAVTDEPAVIDEPGEEVIYTDVKVTQNKRTTKPNEDQISTELPPQTELSKSQML